MTNLLENKMAVSCQRVERTLTDILDALPKLSTDLKAAMRYGVLTGGKRLRPFLVYAVGQLFAVPIEDLDVPAAAIECIHAYSLIHDDIPAMDNDRFRRGQPSCFVQFGEANAILAGDALQTLAFSILSDHPAPNLTAQQRLAMISQLASASGVAGMCSGQALDLAAEGKTLTLPQLEAMHRYKTGALIRAAVRLGALAAGKASVSAAPALDTYADAIGLAFQVQDDILDVVGDTGTLGKSCGSDEKRHKSTYPSLMGLDNALNQAKQLYRASVDALETLRLQSLQISPLLALASYIIEREK